MGDTGDAGSITMDDFEDTDSITLSRVLSTLTHVGNSVMNVESGIRNLDLKLDKKADKDDVAELRVALSGVKTEMANSITEINNIKRSLESHMESPVVHRYSFGLTGLQWVQVGAVLCFIIMIVISVIAYAPEMFEYINRYIQSIEIGNSM